jgi:hypothetical protein
MTHAESKCLIGCHRILEVKLRGGGMSTGVRVSIEDTRVMWGRVEARVVPVNGTGAKWVRIERLKEDNQ